MKPLLTLKVEISVTTAKVLELVCVPIFFSSIKDNLTTSFTSFSPCYAETPKVFNPFWFLADLHFPTFSGERQ